MTVLRLLTATLAGLVWASTAACHAQGYPSKTIRMVVPIAAGGGTDPATRRPSRSARARRNPSPSMPTGNP